MNTALRFTLSATLVLAVGLLLGCKDDSEAKSTAAHAPAADSHAADMHPAGSHPAGRHDVDTSEAGAHSAKAAETVRVTCTVMGGRINKNIYADHDGKRAYFCCGGCVATFNAHTAKHTKKVADQEVTRDAAGADDPAAQ